MPFSGPPAIDYATRAVSCVDLRYSDRGGGTAQVSGTDTAWVANLAVFAPFFINETMVVSEWWINLGTTTTASNWDFGIYREDFTKIQTLGSTAAGTVASNINNTTTWADLTLPAGAYYMAYANDSTRPHATSNDIAGFHIAAGYMEQTSSSFPLPATATPIRYTRAYFPHFGFTLNSWGV